MTRSFTNTLLFESVLDSIDESLPKLRSLSQVFLEPTVRITAEDCGTLLGKEVPVSFKIQGCVERSTGLNITPARISTLMSASNFYIDVRTLDTCIAPGGVCRKCVGAFEGALSKAAPVNSFYKVRPMVLLDVHQRILGSSTTSIKLPYSSVSYDVLQVFLNGQLMDNTQYSISDTTLIFNVSLSNNSNVVFKFFVRTNVQYYYWFCDTFAGSLLGVKKLAESHLPIRKELLLNNIPEADVQSLISNLHSSEFSEEDSIQYLPNIKDPVERTIFAIILGVVFSRN